MTYVIAGSCVDITARSCVDVRPGGASALGPLAADTPLVVALPPPAD